MHCDASSTHSGNVCSSTWNRVKEEPCAILVQNDGRGVLVRPNNSEPVLFWVALKPRTESAQLNSIDSARVAIRCKVSYDLPWNVIHCNDLHMPGWTQYPIPWDWWPFLLHCEEDSRNATFLGKSNYSEDIGGGKD
jgi:hypothetical protein